MKICLSCEGVSDTPAERCSTCGARLHALDAVHFPARRGEIDAANPLLGAVIDGKYRLVGVLGRGGLGTVFRAQHVTSLMYVALKLLHPRFAERAEYRRALVPEARRAATVANDRCARLLDVGETEDGAAYLAMELVEGRTLDLLVRDGPLAPAHAVAVLAQVADALAAIHAAGLVHCDLSPRNVMVAARGGVLRVKVLDFGIARSVTLAGPSRARGEFHGFANPAFAAPELLAGREVDARADLYSFGTLAWLLLTGAMPVDDADPRRAAAAIAAGELRPWPEPRGVGRRLRRLVLHCLQREPAARPASSLAVARELAVVGGARRPRAVRAAAVAWAAGAIAVLAAPSPDATPFLQTKSGSPFALVQAPLAAASPTVHATSAQLAALRCDFAGLDPRRLRVDLVRDGELRQRTDVRPDVAPDGAGLALIAAQPGWREVVAELVRSGQERPSDVVFGVPGAPPLGGVRLRVDDQPPEIEVDGAPTLSHLRRDTLLRWRAKDRVGLARLDAVVAYADGRTVSVPLAPDDASCALGERLAAAGEAVGGGGEVAVVAVDRAGNVARAKALAFAALDVAPPQVVAVTGPGGEAFVPAANGVARARVQLAAAETGARVQIAVGGGEPRAFEWPAGARAMTVDVPATAMAGPATWRVLVRDAAGNETAHEAVVVQRDLDLAIVFPRCDGPARAIGGELVVAPGGRAVAAVGADWRIDSVAIERPDGVELPGEAWSWERGDGATAALAFAEAPAGAYQLQLRVSDRDDPDGFAAIAAVPLRVLPPRLVVRLPAVEAPYLPALLAAGVLQPQAGGDGAVYGEGPAWSLDAALRPYVRARGQRRAGDAVSDIVHEPTGPARALLPAVRPTPGRNRYALAYEDVLQRPVALVVGGREVAADEPFPVVDFWWTSEPSRPVGEELFAEHGKPLRVRVRCPLPFAPSEAEQLRLACAQSELAATSVRASGRDGVEVVFDVPFAQWSAAANLSAIGRDEFAAGLERRLDASLATPAGREPLALRLRTVRSTLQATSLGALRGLPARLAAVRLLPVLPPRTPFAEPVPAAAPPRAAFRPQPAVAVRNLDDFLLQQDEFRCGPARDLVGMLAAIDGARAAACVHAADPAGVQRMTAARLLPAASAGASDDAALVGVDYFQAHALAALLGVVLADDPAAVRLPLGCELEAAAFAGATLPAAHAARAHGGGVAAWPFLPASAAADPVRCGDVVPTAFGEPFVGLDFGVREWVLDLPVAPDALALLREWMADRTVHLARIADLAQGRDERLLAAFGAARALGVVRGLAFGEADGVIDAGGGRIDPAAIARLPDATPGVLRTEQLRRDGRDLLSSGADPRLARVGFRVLVEPARLPTTEVRR